MNSVSVLLACADWVRVPLETVRQVPELSCPQHGPQTVDSYNTHEWRVRCPAPRCRYGAWYGQDEGGAIRGQARHRERHPTHMPRLAYDQVTTDGRGVLLVWDGLYPPRGRPRFTSWTVKKSPASNGEPPF